MEELKKKLQELRKQKEQAVVLVYKIEGAIEVVEQLIKEENERLSKLS